MASKKNNIWFRNKKRPGFTSKYIHILFYKMQKTSSSSVGFMSSYFELCLTVQVHFYHSHNSTRLIEFQRDVVSS